MALVVLSVVEHRLDAVRAVLAGGGCHGSRCHHRGVAVFICFLIPLGAVLVVPAAVAGAMLLARGVLGASLERRWAQ